MLQMPGCFSFLLPLIELILEALRLAAAFSSLRDLIYEDALSRYLLSCFWYLLRLLGRILDTQLCVREPGVVFEEVDAFAANPLLE